MPLINVKLIEGVFNEAQKTKMVTDLTDAMVARRREHAPGHLGGDRRGEERELALGGDHTTGVLVVQPAPSSQNDGQPTNMPLPDNAKPD